MNKYDYMRESFFDYVSGNDIITEAGEEDYEKAMSEYRDVLSGLKSKLDPSSDAAKKVDKMLKDASHKKIKNPDQLIAVNNLIGKAKSAAMKARIRRDVSGDVDQMLSKHNSIF